jgi:preprotein translocase subunit SecD
MERFWYFKLSIVIAMVLVSTVVLLGAVPLGDNIPLIGRYVNTDFQLGLDLSGGERLVYEVLIDDAIAQRRRQTGQGIVSLVNDDLHIEKIGYREEGSENFYLLFEGQSDISKVTHSFVREHGWAEDVSRSSASEAHFAVKEGVSLSVREVARRTGDSIKRALSSQDVRVEILPDRRFAVHLASEADLGRLQGATVEQLQDVELVGRFTKKLEMRLSDDARTSMIDTAVNQAMEVIGNRIDELGLVNTTVSQSGTNIIIEIPAGGGSRSNSASGARTTTAAERVSQIKRIIERTARLEFRIVDDQERRVYQKLQEGARDETRVEVVPDSNSYFLRASDTKQANGTVVPGYKILSEFIAQVQEKGGVDIPDTREFLFEEITPREQRDTKRSKAPVERVWRSYYVQTEARVTGEHIADARRAFETQGPEAGQPYVSLDFNDEGRRAFGQITKANVGKRMAIVLDDRVNSAPVIQEAILGGSARITLGGMMQSRDEQMAEAQELVVVLRAGGLPAPISLVNEETIGPQLGRDAIWQGQISLYVGMIAVFLFMLIYYKGSGIIANIAQIINVLLMFAILALWGATLTLPGLAGIVLTVGMAIDANIIINERIREELRAGKSPRAAVEAGYQRAFWTIFDSQFTTLIAGVVLLDQGTGPIKGFAVTLLIGLVTSMVTAIFVTRVMNDWWTKRKRLEALSI